MILSASRLIQWLGTNFMVLLFLCVLNPLVGQVKFYATTDAKQIVVGNYFELVFTLENARSQQFKAPSFINFDIVGGPNTSTQMSIVNGRSSQKMSYSYTLTSSKIGKYTIQPAVVSVGGQTYKTEPITIEVIKGKAKTTVSGQAQEDLILEAVIDHNVGYVGQQITLKYDILTTLDVRSYNFNSLPNFDGFFAQEIQGYNSKSERIVRDGVQYVRRTIKVIALFPQQKGTFNLDPARAVVGVSNGQQSNNFFFSRRLKQTNVTSEGFTIKVTDLPEGAPQSFSGAIGDFKMGTSVDKKSITMDDAVTLKLQVQGIGDGKFIEAPKQPFEAEWDIYEPNLLSESQQVIGPRIQYTKTYEYLMIPKKAGRLNFRPEFTYFNPDSSQYFRIQAQRYSINVLKGSGREMADIQDETIPLTPIYTTTNLVAKNSTFAFSWGHGIANMCLAFIAFGLLLVKRKEIQRNNIDPALLRNQKAQRLAIAKLADAKKELDEGKVTPFYIQLRKGLTSYLADKTNLPSDQLSKVEIQSLLEDNDLTEHLEDILLIMQKGEQAIYASIPPGDEVGTYNQTIEIIKAMEQTLAVEV